MSGGEFDVAANLADCFRLKTAMVDSPRPHVTGLTTTFDRIMHFMQNTKPLQVGESRGDRFEKWIRPAPFLTFLLTAPPPPR